MESRSDKCKRVGKEFDELSEDETLNNLVDSAFHLIVEQESNVDNVRGHRQYHYSKYNVYIEGLRENKIDVSYWAGDESGETSIDIDFVFNLNGEREKYIEKMTEKYEKLKKEKDVLDLRRKKEEIKRLENEIQKLR